MGEGKNKLKAALSSSGEGVLGCLWVAGIAGLWLVLGMAFGDFIWESFGWEMKNSEGSVRGVLGCIAIVPIFLAELFSRGVHMDLERLIIRSLLLLAQVPLVQVEPLVASVVPSQPPDQGIGPFAASATVPLYAV